MWGHLQSYSVVTVLLRYTTQIGTSGSSDINVITTIYHTSPHLRLHMPSFSPHSSYDSTNVSAPGSQSQQKKKYQNSRNKKKIIV